ncbi:MAG: shikimate kinase [Pirellulaceae bacterium]|nr:MAG: shikimate kinase [Pirellulaceae bacterium]
MIGFRGCGKSTIGRALADRLGRDFVDTDDLIEQEAGKSISEIFRVEGERGFRDREEKIIARCAQLSQPTIVALGGGAVLRAANRQAIRRSGRCVWLQATVATHLERLTSDPQSRTRRPALTSQTLEKEIAVVLQSREPLYAELAEKTVSVDHRTPDDIVLELMDWLNVND